MEKSDIQMILELESMLNQGGRPLKEEKESVTLRISAPLARKAKESYNDERSRIYELSLIAQLRKDNLLPPPLTPNKPSPKGFEPDGHLAKLRAYAAQEGIPVAPPPPKPTKKK